MDRKVDKVLDNSLDSEFGKLRIEKQVAILPDTGDIRHEVNLWGYGHTHIIVTQEHIDALLDGQQLAWSDGEYTTTVSMTSDEDDSPTLAPVVQR